MFDYLLGFYGITIDAFTSVVLDVMFYIGILVVIGVVLYVTKWYKRILHRWQITLLWFDQRAKRPILKVDKIRRVVEKDGLEKAEVLSTGEKFDFPSLSDLVPFGNKVVLFAHRLETGVWLPVKIKLENPDAEIINNLKDMKFSVNMKKILDRETRTRWSGKGFMEKYGWLLFPVAMGIFILLVAYANYTYLWIPQTQRVDSLTSQNIEITKAQTDQMKALTDAIKTIKGIPTTSETPIPVIPEKPPS